MAQVEVKIGMYHYPIACKDGQEDHLRQLAIQFDQRLASLAQGLKRGVDIKTIVTAGIFMENEIQELRLALEVSRQENQEALRAANINKDLGGIYQSLEAIAEMLEKR